MTNTVEWGGYVWTKSVPDNLAEDDVENNLKITNNPLHKMLYEDYGLIHGKHYTEAAVVGTKDGYRITFTPIKKIKYLEFEMEFNKND